MVFALGLGQDSALVKGLDPPMEPNQQARWFETLQSSLGLALEEYTLPPRVLNTSRENTFFSSMPISATGSLISYLFEQTLALGYLTEPKSSSCITPIPHHV